MLQQLRFQAPLLPRSRRFGPAIVGLMVLFATTNVAFAQRPPDLSELGSGLEPQVADESPDDRSPSYFGELWRKRRAALEAGELEAAAEYLQAFLDAKQEAGWPNAFIYGGALALEASSVAAESPERARSLAEAATRFAPDLPRTHRTLSRVLWRQGDFAGAINARWRSLWLRIQEPPLFYLRYAQLGAVLWLAGLISAAVFAALLVHRYAIPWVYDIQRLSRDRLQRPVAGLLALALLTAPILAGLGPAWTVALWLAVLSLYFSRYERIAAALALALLLATPLLLPRLTQHLTYVGSRAHDIYRAVRTLDAEDAAARLAAQEQHRPEELYALGLRAHWSGWETEARTWLERAVEQGYASAEIFTALGNVRFRLDDEQGAIASYLKAIELDGNHVVAHFNLSRVYYAMAEHQKAGTMHREATAIDYDRVEAFTQAVKRFGPAYIVPEAVSEDLLASTVRGGLTHRAAVEEMWRWVGQGTQRTTFAVAMAALFVVIVAMEWLRHWFRPARRCPRCGMPALLQADPSDARKELCSECVQAFYSEETEARQLRVRKEIEVHRYEARCLRERWLASILIPGAGQVYKGWSLRGLALMVVFGWGLGLALISFRVIEPLVVLESAPQWLSGIVAGSIALAVYGISLWDGVRQER